MKQALTDFLYQAQSAQGTQTLHVTEPVRFAVRKLFAGDAIGSAQIEAFLAGTALPGSAPDFADAVTKLLPEFVPRARAAHLGTLSPKGVPIPARNPSVKRPAMWWSIPPLRPS